MLHGNPKARIAIYGLTLLVMALAAFHVIDGSQASRLNDIITLAALTLGIAAPSVALSNVRRNAATPAGTPAEQLAAAVKGYADARAAEDAALQQAMQAIPAGPIADAIRAATQVTVPAPVQLPAPVPTIPATPELEYAPTTYQPVMAGFMAKPDAAGFLSKPDPSAYRFAEPVTNGQVVTFCGDAPR